MSYTIPPFSGPKYRENSRKCVDGETPCAICGKGVKGGPWEWPHFAVVINGGSDWGDESSPEEDPGYMGGWPVGTACHSKYFKK